jgi:MFS family permease
MVQAVGGTAQQVKSSFREVLAYLRSIRKSFLCLNLGFAILALSGYGYGAWLPTFFVRRHGWTAPHAATVIGILSILCGTAGVLAGGRIADYLRSRGGKDANMRVGLYAAIAGLPFAVLLCLLPNADVAAWMLAPTLFIAGLPIPAAGAAIQEIVPNEMRGQATAIFLFASNLIGLGLGPTAVALLTDFLFHNDNMINYSMLLVILFAHSVSSALLWSGLRPYVQSMERLSGWVLKNSTS